MSRRHRAEKREIHPDPKFGDRDLTKFMNYIMLDGKKSVAERIVYGALDIVEDKLKRELMDAASNRGTAVKKREDTHRMAEANRAFSHYRW